MHDEAENGQVCLSVFGVSGKETEMGQVEQGGGDGTDLGGTQTPH